MATGGAAPSSSCEQAPDSARNCSVCEESGIRFEASWYCQDCDKCLCTFCLRDHNKFLKNHTIIGREQRSDWIKPRRNLEQECVKHTGSPISMYCGRHDDVCCPVCAALEHGPKCHGWVSYIPDIKEGLVSDQNYQRVLDNIDGIIAGYTDLEKKGKQTTKVLDAKAKSICTMKDFRRKVLNVLADLELKSIVKMNDFTENLDDEIASSLQVLNETKQELENKKTADEIEKFKVIKSRLKQIRQHERFLFEQAQCFESEIKFKIDDKVQTALETLENAPLFGILQSTRSNTDHQSNKSAENGNQQLGTTVKFQPPRITEEPLNIQKTFTMSRLQVITGMKEYETKCLEELRFEDYQANRKGQQIACIEPVLNLQQQSLRCDSLPSAMIVDSADSLRYTQSSTEIKPRNRLFVHDTVSTKKVTRIKVTSPQSTTSVGLQTGSSFVQASPSSAVSSPSISDESAVFKTPFISSTRFSESELLMNPSSVGVSHPMKKEELATAVPKTWPRQIPQPGLAPASVPSAVGTKPPLLPASSLTGQGQSVQVPPARQVHQPGLAPASVPSAAGTKPSLLPASSLTGQGQSVQVPPARQVPQPGLAPASVPAAAGTKPSLLPASSLTGQGQGSPGAAASMLSQLAAKHQETANTGQAASAVTSVLMSTPQKTVFQGFTFSSTPKITETNAEKPKEEVKVATTTAGNPKPFSGFSFTTPSTPSSAKTPTTQTQPAPSSFGSLSTPSTFGSLAAGGQVATGFGGAGGDFKGFAGAGQTLFNKSPSPRRNPSIEYEPNVDFQPVVPLPDLVEVKTGEEDEIKLFGERAKLFRFDKESNQWKERGVGAMKVLQHSETKVCRILMRREQVLKLCANHNITKDIKLFPMSSSEKAWIWSAPDFSDGEVKYEKLAVRFKNQDIAEKFKKTVEECQEKMNKPADQAEKTDKKAGEPTKKKEGKAETAEKKPEAAASGQKGNLASLFKPKEGSWTCTGCYDQSNSDVLKCPCCNSLKPGVTKEDLPAEKVGSSGSSGFSFGSQPAIQTNSSGGFNLAPANENTSATNGQKGNLASLFKPKEGSWTCTGCYVQSNSDVLKCPCCNSLKPDVTKEDIQAENAGSSGCSFGSQQAFQTNSSGGFNLASMTGTTAATNSEAGGFKFGTQSTDTAASSTSGPGFAFGTPAATTTAAPQTGGFIFGTQSSGASTSTGTSASSFSLGTPSTTTAAPQTGGFMFGTQSSGASTSTGTSASSSTFGTPAATTAAPQTGGFMFGTQSSGASTSTGTSASSFSLGTPSTTTAAPQTGGFMFGTQSSGASTSTGTSASSSTFGTPAATTAAPQTGGFMFGTQSSGASTSTGTSASSSTFGTPAATTAAPQTGGFMFDTQSSGVATSTGTSASSSTFGTPAATTAAPQTGGFMFGTQSSGAAISAGTFASSFTFGTAAATTTAAPQTGGFMFGTQSSGASLSTSTSASSISLGTPSTATSTAALGGLFGGGATRSRSSAGGFSFCGDASKGVAAPQQSTSTAQSEVTSPQPCTPSSGFTFGGDDSKGVEAPQPSTSKAQSEVSLPQPCTPSSGFTFGGDATKTTDDSTAVTGAEFNVNKDATKYTFVEAAKSKDEPSKDAPKKDMNNSLLAQYLSAPDTNVEEVSSTTSDTGKEQKPLFGGNTASKFTFGNPASTFSFGSPSTPAFTVGSAVNKEEKEEESHQKKPGSQPTTPVQQTEGFKLNMTPSKDTDKPQPAAKLGGGFHFSLNMTPGMPPKTSPIKSPGVTSPRSPEVTDDGLYVTKEGDDSHIHFEPIVQLADKVDVTTGEEGEEVIFSHRAKLYRFTKDEWKERGLGDVKVLLCPDTHKARILMRREQILKLCCNHYITPELKFKEMPKMSRKVLSWFAMDFSDGEPKPEKLSIRFKTADIAADFQKAVEDAKQRTQSNKHDAPSEPAVETIGATAESTSGASDEVSIVKEEKATAEEIAKARELMLPDHFFLYRLKSPCTGCRGCKDDTVTESDQVPVQVEEEEEEYDEDDDEDEYDDEETEEDDYDDEDYEDEDEEEEAAPTSGPAKLEPSGFMFGESFGGISFASVAGASSGPIGFQKDDNKPFHWHGAGQQLFGGGARGKEEGSGDEEEVQEGAEPHFEPIVPLPELIEVKTGEEDETKEFCQRAKLFRYDAEKKEWKEKGIGEMKILKHKETGKYRFLLRREQVHKLACNHLLTPDLNIQPMSTSETAWCWLAQDYSENELKVEKLAVKFKNIELAKSFKAKVDEIQALLREAAS